MGRTPTAERAPEGASPDPSGGRILFGDRVPSSAEANHEAKSPGDDRSHLRSTACAHAVVFDSDTAPAGELRVTRRCDAAVICTLSSPDAVQKASSVSGGKLFDEDTGC